MNKGIFKIVSSILLCSFLVYTTPVLAYTKEETVYSKVDANGNNYKTIVSTHLKNENQEQILKDISDLINIENTNGDETFTQNGEEITWAANGSDIYYQGETQKQLPIKCNIKYELNGKEINPQDLAGKSGKVKITISYENTDEHRVVVNGKTVSMYTPFTVICAVMFDNTQNKNIEVSSGKVVNDGTKTMIMGVVLPGMQQSLNISKNKIDLPESIEITMDTDNYEQKNIVTFVTPKIFEEKFSFNELNSLYSKIGQIQEASKKLVEGANTLKDGSSTLSTGASTLSEKYTEFDNGIAHAYSGSKDLSDGTSKINDGVSGLQAGTANLNAGVIQINQALDGVDLSDLETLIQGIVTINCGASDLKEGSASLEAGANSLEVGVGNYVDSAEKLANGVKQLETSLNLLDEMIAITTDSTTKAQLQATRDGIAGAVDGAKELTKTDNNGLTLGAKLKAGSSQVSYGATSLNTGATELSKGTAQLNTASSKISSIGEKVTSLKTNLETVQAGTGILNKKMIELKEGTEQVNKGSETLTDGLEQLNTNSKNVKSALSQLADGGNKLAEGSIQLASGIEEFKTQAIDKIVNYVNSDVKDIVARAEKLQELSDKYANFTKSEDKSTKEVKFILITDSIKMENKREED